MKKPLWQDVLFALSAFVFVCLLLSGGPRLIAAPEEDVPPVLPVQSWLEASVTCPPSGNGAELQVGPPEEMKAAVKALGFCGSESVIKSLPLTDANGNILSRRSYMRAVYQVFALGDGFA